jgi:predicted phage terminase large subunit-like protein
MVPNGIELSEWSALSDLEAQRTQTWTAKKTRPQTAEGISTSSNLAYIETEPWTPPTNARPHMGLFEFVKVAWRILEPAEPFVDNWHLHSFVEHAEAISTGKLPERNLLVNTPPGTTKSLFWAVMWPAWEWTWAPWTRWLTMSYDDTLAIRDAVRTRRLMQTDWYQLHALYERWVFVGDQNVKGNYVNDRTGWRIATSIKGAVTGNHAHRVMVDDPHNVKKAESDAERESTLSIWREAIPSRVLPSGTRVMIGQRTHEEDATADWLDRERADIHHIELKMEYEAPPPATSPGTAPGGSPVTAGTFDRHCSLTHRPHDPRTVEGDLLVPSRYPRPVIERRKIELGPYAYSGQYQQSPTPRAGMVLDPAWIVQTPDELNWSNMDTVMVWDLNYSSKDTSDWTVGMLASVERSGELPKIHIRGVFRDHLSEVMHDQIITDQVVLYRPMLVGIEKRAYEHQGATQDLVRRVMLALDRQHVTTTIEPVDADIDKLSRAMIIPGRARAGLITADKRATWWTGLSREMSSFPRGSHDDQVDCLAHLVRLVVEKLQMVRAQRALLGNTSHVQYIDPAPPSKRPEWMTLVEGIR